MAKQAVGGRGVLVGLLVALFMGLPVAAAAAGVSLLGQANGGDAPVGGAAALASAANAQSAGFGAGDRLTGPRVRLVRSWVGRVRLPQDAPILIMAGHADSQFEGGAGTCGEAVGLRGAARMDPTMSDELYWNLLVVSRVESLGRQRGLAISSYVPLERNIADGDDPQTNWSRGKAHVLAGGYALEIHHDAYGPDGFGSGLIPRPKDQTRVDEALAREFGGFPADFRDVLGSPKRGIAMLEIGKLEGRLEAAYRAPSTRSRAIETVATRIVGALERGLGRPRGSSRSTNAWLWQMPSDQAGTASR